MEDCRNCRAKWFERLGGQNCSNLQVTHGRKLYKLITIFCIPTHQKKNLQTRTFSKDINFFGKYRNKNICFTGNNSLAIHLLVNNVLKLKLQFYFEEYTPIGHFCDPNYYIAKKDPTTFFISPNSNLYLLLTYTAQIRVL